MPRNEKERLETHGRRKDDIRDLASPGRSRRTYAFKRDGGTYGQRVFQHVGKENRRDEHVERAPERSADGNPKIKFGEVRRPRLFLGESAMACERQHEEKRGVKPDDPKNDERCVREDHTKSECEHGENRGSRGERPHEPRRTRKSDDQGQEIGRQRNHPEHGYGGDDVGEVGRHAEHEAGGNAGEEGPAHALLSGDDATRIVCRTA
jgi:hypothetical protein